MGDWVKRGKRWKGTERKGKEKGEKGYDIVIAWGSEESVNKNEDETSLMAIRDSDIEKEEVTSDVSILKLKEK